MFQDGWNGSFIVGASLAHGTPTSGLLSQSNLFALAIVGRLLTGSLMDNPQALLFFCWSSQEAGEHRTSQLLVKGRR